MTAGLSHNDGGSNNGDGDGNGARASNGNGVSSAARSAGAAPVGASKPCHKILIVEDHEDTARAISKLLMREGHDVRVERTIGGAVSYCQRPDTRVELLIADITLPDGNGWELMRRLTEICKPLLGIAFSGHGMPSDLEQSKLAGFAEHLTKPVLFQDLLSAIRRVMSAAASSSGRAVPPPSANAADLRSSSLNESGI